jgi:hypothetical protein
VHIRLALDLSQILSQKNRLRRAAARVNVLVGGGRVAVCKQVADAKQNDVTEIREAARRATLDLRFAFRMANSGDDGALESFLDEWVTLVPGCIPENEFCDNADGLAIVQKEPTGPYLPEWLVCSARPDTGCQPSYD